MKAIDLHHLPRLLEYFGLVAKHPTLRASVVELKTDGGADTDTLVLSRCRPDPSQLGTNATSFPLIQQDPPFPEIKQL